MMFSQSLKRNSDFRRAYSRGRSAAGRYVAVYCRRNGSAGNRLGITVGTKVGKAVVRNSIRRRLREAYRLAEGGFLRGWDIVIVARGRAAGADYRTLRDDMFLCAKALGLMREAT